MGDVTTSGSMDCRWMPEISRFFGIVIAMYYADHALPHVHAKYGGQRMSVAIDDARILSGDLPGRAKALVLEWLELHRDELLADWRLVQARKPLRRIEPLE